MALALDLDDDLAARLAREVVHAVQNARKQAGLEITDRIELRLGGDPELVDAARAHEDYVAGETLANSIEFRDVRAALRRGSRGRELVIAVRRSG